MKSSEKIWKKPVSHGEILKTIWNNLDLGTLQRRHPFHTPVFGTLAGGEPSLRVVVLQRFWRKPPMLAFHSHIGSPKIKQIEVNPSVYWLFYNVEEKLQVRIKGTAEIHLGDKLAEEQWQSTELFSRRCYIGEAPTQLKRNPSSGLPETLIDREPTREESETGRTNFVVITSTIEEIDCLEMNFKGHRRSLFTWNKTGELETKWLTP